MTDTTIEEITDLARDYAAARERLAGTSEAIRKSHRAAVRRRMAALKRHVAEVKATREALCSAVDGAPHLFKRPRTRALEGVKVGFRKMSGRLEVSDEGRTIGLIRKVLPKQETELVRVSESINKTAVRKLTSRDLSRIGVSIIHVDDEVVCQTATDDIDQLVDALMADGEEEEAS